MIQSEIGLGPYLAQVRVQAGRSLRNISAELNFSKSTIARWEHEIGSPNLGELVSLLSCYRLPEEEIKRAVASFKIGGELLPSQISMRRDLLRFARLRSGLSLRVAAKLLGIDYTTLSHWETGKRWPGESPMDGALLRMGASQKEIDYLESNLDSVLRPGSSLTQIEVRIAEVKSSIPFGSIKEFDLEYFRLRGLLSAQTTPAAGALSFELLSVYVRWLDWWKRPESCSLAIKELTRFRFANGDQDWVPIVRAAACYYAEIKRDVETAIELVDHACKRLKGTKNESQLLREAADLRLKVNEWDEARRLLAKSQDLIPGEESDSRRTFCLKVVAAQSWSGQGNHTRALESLPNRAPNDLYLAASSAIAGAAIYRSAGLFDEADRTLAAATTRCRERDFPHLTKSLLEATSTSHSN